MISQVMRKVKPLCDHNFSLILVKTDWSLTDSRALELLMCEKLSSLTHLTLVVEAEVQTDMM